VVTLKLTNPYRRGSAVTALQKALEHSGRQIAIDGVFGPATQAAVKAFQRSHDLAPDGICGPRTWAALGYESAPVPKPAAVRIVEKAWHWAHPMVTRTGSAPGIVYHHAAAPRCTAEDVDRWHRANGWAGIGYHFFVRLSGEIDRGRPEGAMGAHCLGHNDWIGVCAEGDYERPGAVMPPAQLKSLQALHRYLHAKYGSTPDRKHKDMPGNATACPGIAYPFGQVVKG
jgi:N-acetyl-anhydromuramyl-L-alanine amidase AmpD